MINKLAQLTPSQRNEYQLRFLAGGALAGTSVASILNLIHAVRTAKREKEEEAARLNPSEDTIVLTLPPKVACDNKPGHSSIKDTVTPKTKVTSRIYKTQYRSDGKFDERLAKKSQAVPAKPTQTIASPSAGDILVASLLGVGGATAGYSLANYLYDVYRKNILNKEVEQAKSEYMDKLLANTSKAAAVVNEQIGGNLTKSAQTSFDSNILNQSLAGYLLVLIASLGGSSYLVKRMLDVQAKKLNTDPDTWRPPKLRKIVFDTASTNRQTPDVSTAANYNEEKIPKAPEPLGNVDEDALQARTDQLEKNPAIYSAAETQLPVKAAFAVILDQISGNPCLHKSAEVKSVMDKAGLKLDDLIKLAQVPDTPADAYRKYLAGHPEVSTALVDASFKHNIPLIGRMLSKLAPAELKARMANAAQERLINPHSKAGLIGNKDPNLKAYIKSKNYKQDRKQFASDPVKLLTTKLDQDPEFRSKFLEHASRSHPAGVLYRGAYYMPGINYAAGSVGKELAKVELNRQLGAKRVSEKVPKPEYSTGIGGIDLKKLDADIPGSLKKKAQIEVPVPAQMVMDALVAPQSPEQLEAEQQDPRHIASKIKIMAKNKAARQFVNAHQQQIMAALTNAIEDVMGDMRRQ